MELKKIGKILLVSLAVGSIFSWFSGFLGFIGGFFGAFFGKLVLKPSWEKKIKPWINKINKKIEENKT